MMRSCALASLHVLEYCMYHPPELAVTLIFLEAVHGIAPTSSRVDDMHGVIPFFFK